MVTQNLHPTDNPQTPRTRFRRVVEHACSASKVLLVVAAGFAIAGATRGTAHTPPHLGWLTAHPLRPLGAVLMTFGLSQLACSLIQHPSDVH